MCVCAQKQICILLLLLGTFIQKFTQTIYSPGCSYSVVNQCYIECSMLSYHMLCMSYPEYVSIAISFCTSLTSDIGYYAIYVYSISDYAADPDR